MLNRKYKGFGEVSAKIMQLTEKSMQLQPKKGFMQIKKCIKIKERNH